MIRVFISSTMKDLANERDAVCRHFMENGIEPVNAEGWLPTGAKSWNRIELEIKSCDMFLLILGERYGWIPNAGPMSELGLSVTHLEFREARNNDLRILPFFKRLDYETDKSSDNAIRRDAFREEVGSWHGGHFVKEFELAIDLAKMAFRTVIEVMSDDYQRSRIRARSSQAERSALLLDLETIPTKGVPKIVIPEKLTQAVARQEAVLYAGAGLSLAAGLPSTSVVAEYLDQVVQSEHSGFNSFETGMTFGEVAEAVDHVFGRHYLVKKVISFLNLMEGDRPFFIHKIHEKAIRLFKFIVTTNFDNLFEKAASLSSNRRYQIFTPDLDYGSHRDAAIVKLHGTIDNPASLVLTNLESCLLKSTHPKLWGLASSILQDRPVVIIGTPLKECSELLLFNETNSRIPRYYVAPGISPGTKIRLNKWNIAFIDADIIPFFSQLEVAVEESLNII